MHGSGKHRDGTIELARNELFSHIQRCGVLGASESDQTEWLDDTMGYIADRYPDLGKLELAHLESMGRRYLRPAIPHGRGLDARNRDEWTDDNGASEQEELAGAAA